MCVLLGAVLVVKSDQGQGEGPSLSLPHTPSLEELPRAARGSWLGWDVFSIRVDGFSIIVLFPTTSVRSRRIQGQSGHSEAENRSVLALSFFLSLSLTLVLSLSVRLALILSVYVCHCRWMCVQFWLVKWLKWKLHPRLRLVKWKWHPRLSPKTINFPPQVNTHHFIYSIAMALGRYTSISPVAILWRSNRLEGITKIVGHVIVVHYTFAKRNHRSRRSLTCEFVVPQYVVFFCHRARLVGCVYHLRFV